MVKSTKCRVIPLNRFSQAVDFGFEIENKIDQAYVSIFTKGLKFKSTEY